MHGDGRRKVHLDREVGRSAKRWEMDLSALEISRFIRKTITSLQFCVILAAVATVLSVQWTATNLFAGFGYVRRNRQFLISGRRNS